MGTTYWHKGPQTTHSQFNRALYFMFLLIAIWFWPPRVVRVLDSRARALGILVWASRFWGEPVTDSIGFCSGVATFLLTQFWLKRLTLRLSNCVRLKSENILVRISNYDCGFQQLFAIELCRLSPAGVSINVKLDSSPVLVKKTSWMHAMLCDVEWRKESTTKLVKKAYTSRNLWELNVWGYPSMS